MSHEQPGGPQDSSPKPELFPDVFYERWATKNFPAFLKAYFVASILAYPVHEEIMERAGNIPRDIRTAIDDNDPEEAAAAVMQAYQKELASGEPIPIDLFTFYLEQEQAAEGISDAERRAAEERFGKIIGYAKDLQEKNDSRDEVLGYVLKQQGLYDPKTSLLSDLLTENRGDCEARERYISAAVQKLYPDDVAGGHMKTEVFGSYTDDAGNQQDGHVRVIIDRGQGVVEVLEGDAVQTEPAAEHASIPATETTQLAVKGFAAKEGIYTFENPPAKSAEPQATPNVWSALEKGVEHLLTDNSVTEYPASTAHYPSQNFGLENIDPKPVRNRWDGSRLFHEAIEVTLKHELPDLTMDNWEDALTRDGIDLTPFNHIGTQAFTEAMTKKERRENRLRMINARADQVIPHNIKLLERLHPYYVINPPNKPAPRGSLHPLDGARIDFVIINHPEAIPLDWLKNIAWIGENELHINLKEQKTVLGEEQLNDLLTSGVESIVISQSLIDSEKDEDLMLELQTPTKSTHEVAHLNKLTLRGIALHATGNTSPFAHVETDSFDWFTRSMPKADILQGLKAESVSLGVDPYKREDEPLMPFSLTALGVRSTIAHIHLELGEAVTLSDDAFNGVSLKTLSIEFSETTLKFSQKNRIKSDQFLGSNIKRLVVKGLEMRKPFSNERTGGHVPGPTESIVIQLAAGEDSEQVRENFLDLRMNLGTANARMWAQVPVYIVPYFNENDGDWNPETDSLEKIRGYAAVEIPKINF